MTQLTRNLRTMFVFVLLTLAGTAAANLGDADDDDLDNPLITRQLVLDCGSTSELSLSARASLFNDFCGSLAFFG